MERPRWPYATKLTISLLLLAFFIYLLTRFREIILPIIIAIIVAYILNPFVNFLEKRFRIPRVLATFLTYLFVLAIIILVPIVIIPRLGVNLVQLQLNPQQIISSIESAIAQQYVIGGITIHPSTFANQVISALQGLLQPVVGQTVNLVKTIITSIIWVILILLVSFYLIKDSSKLEIWFTSHLPPTLLPDYKWIRDEINLIWAAFFRGQLLLSLVVAILFIIVGLILGLPYAIAMGILAGILEFLPSVGHGIWLVTASLLALFLGSSWIPLPNWAFMLIVIGFHLVYEQFDLNYLIPRIVGRRIHLPPLVVILGIVTGAILAGVLGIPLAAPTIASLRVIGRYIFDNLFDMDWTPVSIIQPLPPPKTYWWQRTHRKEK
ncbi:MAG: AI-2E family transporter [Anaerolineales bacterium]